MRLLRHRIIIEYLALQPIQAGVRAHPNTAIQVFRQSANGSPKQVSFHTKESYALLAEPNQSGAPTRPKVTPAVLEQRQDRLAQGRRAGHRLEPASDPAKQAGIGSGPKVSVTVFEERGDMQTGQPLFGPKVRHLLSLPAEGARAIRSAPDTAVTRGAGGEHRMLAGKGRQWNGHHQTLLDLQQTGRACAHPEQAVFILSQTQDFDLDPGSNRQQPLPRATRSVKEDPARGGAPNPPALILEQREPLELLRVLRPRIGLQRSAPLPFLEFIHAQVPAGERVNRAGGYPQSAIASQADRPHGLGRGRQAVRHPPTAIFKDPKLAASHHPQPAVAVAQDLSHIH